MHINAQDISGNIEGKIVDSLDVPLIGADILAESESLQRTSGASTNNNGYFYIPNLPVGVYKISVSMMGFQKVVITEVHILLGATNSLGTIHLKMQSIETDEVVISGNKVLIDPSSTEYGGILRSNDFKNLPLDRDYKSIVALLPLANTSYFGDQVNFAGATGFENKYFIDGMDVSDGFNSGSGTDLPYNFIKDIEVKTGGYEAEYKSSLGGIINVITNSGTNEWHGSAFGFYTSNQFVSKQRHGSLDPSLGVFSQYDVGIGLNGALVRDVLWFNVSYNPNFGTHNVEVPDFGIYIDRNISHLFAGKLSWKAAHNFQLNFNTNGDPSFRKAVEGNALALKNPDPYLTDRRSGGINFSLNGTYSAENILVQSMIAAITSEFIIKPSTDVGKNNILIDSLGTQSGGPDYRDSDTREIQTEFRTNLTYLLEKHKIKTGFEYKDNKQDDRKVDNTSIWIDSSGYWDWFFHSNGSTHVRTYSLFVQDSWQLNSWLKLNYGIRWDGQYLIGTNNSVDQKITGPLQPRIGFIILPFNDGHSKIFGSFGRYVQELSTTINDFFFNGNTYSSYILYPQDPRHDNSGGTIINYDKTNINPEVKGLSSQYYDEFSLGYQQSIFTDYRLTIQGIYRILRRAIDDVLNDDGQTTTFGNPGFDLLSDFPKATREYKALAVTVDRYFGKNFNFLASYVLSRNYGNYSGLYNSSFPIANSNSDFQVKSNIRDYGTGLLPNDRTHVFKISGVYNFEFGFSAGISFLAESGTPLSEYGGTDGFVSKRGTAGRTPSLWDLNARFTYNIMNLVIGYQPKIILDLFHIASNQLPVIYNQYHYGTFINGAVSDPNPYYGLATKHQPSMSVRFGMEVSF